MRVLIADDDSVTRRLLQGALASWGYDVEAMRDGEGAWSALRRDDGAPLAVLNWMMPGLDGVEVCRRVRSVPNSRPIYIILLTARSGRKDIVSSLQAGADDYVTKPFNVGELRARVQVGERMVGLQAELADRVNELEEALRQEQRLQGLLPICSYCKKIRDDRNYWQEVESYIGQHSEARFSHRVCPDCYQRFVGPLLDEPRDRNE